jgi:hypothetical protein
MNLINGNVLQRNISRVFPNKLLANAVEILFLFLMGAVAMLIHAKLRIPMHLPGKSGLMFMIIVVMARSSSKFSFGASLTCLGGASLLLLTNLGFDDPFMPLVYIALGIIMDILFGLTTLIKNNVALIALAAGISWMFIPIIRSLLFFVTGFPYESLMGGMIVPLITHFIFGLSGGLIGAGLVYWAGKSQK